MYPLLAMTLEFLIALLLLSIKALKFIMYSIQAMYVGLAKLADLIVDNINSPISYTIDYLTLAITQRFGVMLGAGFATVAHGVYGAAIGASFLAGFTFAALIIVVGLLNMFRLNLDIAMQRFSANALDTPEILAMQADRANSIKYIMDIGFTSLKQRLIIASKFFIQKPVAIFTAFLEGQYLAQDKPWYVVRLFDRLAQVLAEVNDQQQAPTQQPAEPNQQTPAQQVTQQPAEHKQQPLPQQLIQKKLTIPQVQQNENVHNGLDQAIGRAQERNNVSIVFDYLINEGGYAGSRIINWTEKLRQELKTSKYVGHTFFAYSLTEQEAREMLKQNEHFKCEISGGLPSVPIIFKNRPIKTVTRDSVIELASNHFDLLRFLTEMQEADLHPISHQQLYIEFMKDDISFDVAKQQAIQKAIDVIKFRKITATAIATKNFQELLKHLQNNHEVVVPSANGENIVTRYDIPWSTALQNELDTITNASDWEFNPTRKISRIDGVAKKILEDNKDWLCGITNDFPREPVYVCDDEGVKHYYDLVPLLDKLHREPKTPLNGKIINSLSEIFYDADRKDAIATMFKTTNWDELIRQQRLQFFESQPKVQKPQSAPKKEEPVLPLEPTQAQSAPKAEEPVLPLEPTQAQSAPKAEEPVLPLDLTQAQSAPKKEEPVLPLEPTQAQSAPKAEEPVLPLEPTQAQSAPKAEEPVLPLDLTQAQSAPKKEEPVLPLEPTQAQSAPKAKGLLLQQTLPRPQRLRSQKSVTFQLPAVVYTSATMAVPDAAHFKIQ